MNNILKRVLFLYVIVFLTIGILFYFNVIDKLTVRSAVYAGLLNLINVLMATTLYSLSKDKPNSTFMIYNLGGMVARFFVNIPIIILIIKFLNIDKYAFILVFFIFYFVSLGLEVQFYTKNSQKKT